jgi:hypothetical protein
MSTRNCHIHGTTVGAKDSCPDCLAWFQTRPDPAMMTPDERVAEMDRWFDILEIDFAKLHQRIEELVGRPVWTHELAHQEALTEEARDRHGDVDLGIVLGRFPEGKPVIGVVVE